MTPKGLISKAPQFYKTDDVFVYDAIKMIDRYGFQYIIKGKKTPLNCAIHFTEAFENNDFGRYDATAILLSTMEPLKIGSIIETRGQFFAIAKQKPRNQVLNEYDFECYSLFDYYKEFIVDSQDQITRILGADSSRYILQIPSDIPILPSRFAKAEGKFIAFEVENSSIIASPYKNQDGFITQSKKDDVKFYAVGLDTNELQEFLLNLYSLENLGLCNLPSWGLDKRYAQDFDLKANLHSLKASFSYELVTTKPLEAEQILRDWAISISY